MPASRFIVIIALMGDAQYRLNLLGGFRLERDGREQRPARRKSESLLGYLALYPQEHPREKLATLFWGDHTEDNARRSLRQALSDLRRALGDDALLGDNETVGLNPDLAFWVDVRALRSLLQAAREPNAFLSCGEQFLEFSSFEILPGFYDEWLALPRDQLRADVVQAVLELVAQARTQSEYRTAIELVQIVFRLDPANETGHQHAIVCYSALGDRAAALEQYERCKRALQDELGVAPAPETQTLYQGLVAQTRTRSAAARLTNLPIPASSFIGRDKELGELGGLVRSSAKLVTLVGPGGSGKTRLATELAAQFVAEISDGAWWVDLTALTEPALVPLQVAKAFEIQPAAGQDVTQALGEFLEDKRLLLVLDNCEHLVAASAALVNALVMALPKLAVLATSREALNVAGEQVYPVVPLGVPNATTLALANTLLSFGAIRLFVDRAHKINPTFVLNDTNALAIAQICTRLDGIPLAVELAAARVKHLDVQEIAARLQDRFALLTGGSRTAMPRQQTLRALIDGSFNLLAPEEQVLFRRLTVFEGGWTLEAAEAVCGFGESVAMMDVLGRLVDKSLVVFESEQGKGHYRFLETIREYAREKLEDAGEIEMLRQRHLGYFVGLAEQAEPHLQSPHQAHWTQLLDQESDNLRAALDCGLEQSDATSGLRLVAALEEYWMIRGYNQEGTRYAARALARRDTAMEDVLLGRVFGVAGNMAWLRGEPREAIAMHTQGLEHFRTGGDLLRVGVALRDLGGNYQTLEENERVGIFCACQ